jgi:hypothetical protein
VAVQLLRIILYVALAVLLTAPSIAEAYFDVGTPWRTAATWLGLQVALWASLPHYRSFLVQQATFTLTLLVVGNFFLSPLVALAVEQAVPGRVHNLEDRFHVLRPGSDSIPAVTTNPPGHCTNGVFEYPREPPGTLRIVAIGGSTAAGITIDDGRTSSSLLGARLQSTLGRKVEVINAGLAETQAELQFATFHDSAYAPRVAIFELGIDDWNRAIVRAKQPTLERVAASLVLCSFRQSLLYRGIVPLSGLWRNRSGPEQGESRKVGATAVTQSAIGRSVHVIRFRLSSVDESFHYWLGRIVHECRRQRILCVFAEQPTSNDSGIEPVLRRHLSMTPPLIEAGLLFCPLASRLSPTSEFFNDDRHLTEKGARHAADLLAECLLTTLSPNAESTLKR